ncbi:MAG: type II toxin-antitoxin system HicB family antitoxin [Nitrospinae bacterium]|nr:type II toxin-antitoxin system HicB family antitoxin [Nitrospinota bacterium]
MKDLSYRIILKPEPEGGFTVTVPALPGCVSYGETLEEARLMAADAIKAYLQSVEKHGEAIVDDAGTFESQLIVHYA